MMDGMGRSAWALLVVVLTPAALAAQPSVLEITPLGPECRPLPPCTEVSTCPTGTECRQVSRESGNVCVPHDPVFCCASNVDCLELSSTGTTDGQCAPITGIGLGVCVPAQNPYCGLPISPRRLTACHTFGASPEHVSYPEGDCDRDGIRNRDEIENGSDPCLPETVGVWVPDGGSVSCIAGSARELRCDDAPGDSCRLAEGIAGECTQNEHTGGQALCSVPPHVFCCGGWTNVQCPTGDECTLPSDVDDGFGICTPRDRFCTEAPTEAEIRKCHTFDDRFTSFEEGDCDGDGIANGVEADGRHCIAEEPDAGVPANDAGSHAGDAGAQDAGSEMRDAGRMDAGSMQNGPGFSGGGGCACRSAQGRTGGGGWLAIVAFVLVSWVRRR